ncbi:hypothetical protein P152DRAFT_497812 [Eremomyces bilateralis CBS 781.70]|uniref:HTH psq-type domain-containing protein n=1 Tax=Eremomyces bilateralis CBS 781.70 TaxID=1392243 RepID=A0A6G1FRQ3_9PEZI|nr:uncharacterized protein P152DRAFT_497812 [Eremomyces bilateralis CBS 781.70]KAF1808406.1 hypothetical protein P152DRAFT_497812 [Eremomyces bilateralis CBS 781.70]
MTIAFLKPNLFIKGAPSQLSILPFCQPALLPATWKIAICRSADSFKLMRPSAKRLLFLSECLNIVEALKNTLNYFSDRKFRSLRAASEVYQIPISTIQDQLEGCPTREESSQNAQKLSPIQETYYVDWIVEKDRASRAPSHARGGKWRNASPAKMETIPLAETIGSKNSFAVIPK